MSAPLIQAEHRIRLLFACVRSRPSAAIASPALNGADEQHRRRYVSTSAAISPPARPRSICAASRARYCSSASTTCLAGVGSGACSPNNMRGTPDSWPQTDMRVEYRPQRRQRRQIGRRLIDAAQQLGSHPVHRRLPDRIPARKMAKQRPCVTCIFGGRRRSNRARFCRPASRITVSTATARRASADRCLGYPQNRHKR